MATYIHERGTESNTANTALLVILVAAVIIGIIYLANNWTANNTDSNDGGTINIDTEIPTNNIPIPTENNSGGNQ